MKEFICGEPLPIFGKKTAYYVLHFPEINECVDDINNEISEEKGNEIIFSYIIPTILNEKIYDAPEESNIFYYYKYVSPNGTNSIIEINYIYNKVKDSHLRCLEEIKKVLNSKWFKKSFYSKVRELYIFYLYESKKINLKMTNKAIEKLLKEKSVIQSDLQFLKSLSIKI